MALLKGWSRNRKLSLSWLLLALAFFASGIILIVVAAIFRAQGEGGKLDEHTLRSLVVGKMDLTTATVLGGFILSCVAVGLWGFFDGIGPGHRNNDIGLIIFNWLLIASTIITLIVASIIWFFTLKERANFEKMWLEQNGETQALLQDSLSCCGYWNATTLGLFTQTTGFCGNIVNMTAMVPCVTPITGFADYFLNNVFTTIYGFTIIEVSLFLVSVCLVISRREEERFRRLDEKTGVRGGFV
ncbi:hypothetical protein BCR35DRAFT_343831 [Leucosporidium creatinivorum]|uniref:Tetraspanin n=1 Tax=Leucosporidium creatinivorum TaxID=106004 RepID=A0A1Y2EUB2_9BASI|nr:hypothetical protein BCR35DRAFT_343831 [Leucosporidium creatinivorum]